MIPEDSLFDWGMENRGAGGKGRLGLPPYFEDGVPGLGLPLRSAGSYGISDAGGLDESEPALDRDDFDGDVRFGM